MIKNVTKSKVGLFTLILTPLAIIVMLVVLLVKRGVVALVVKQIKNYRNKNR